MNRKDLARAIYDTSLLRGDFLLRSGRRSDRYFDKYLFEADPLLLADIASKMGFLVPPHIEVLAGLEMGGIPLVTLISHLNACSARFVRKVAKEHGTCNVIEGGPVGGSRVCIIEDVVTSGGQIVLSAKDLREAGAIVDTCVCAIDRQAGGSEALKEAGIDLIPLYTMSDLEGVAG